MSPFTFQSPWMLLLLLGILPLAGLMRRAARERAKVRQTLGGSSKEKTLLRDALRLAALSLLIFALARPGYAPERHATSVAGRDVVFVLDVSRSMLAEDVPPSRLEAAKQAVRDCLDTLENERAALVLYAGSSSIACPLTRDYDFVRYMLEQTQPRAVEFGGSFLLSAVEKTVDQVLESRRAGLQDLIVLSDGGDHGPDMARVTQTLAEHEIDLLLVGLGDAETGARIPVLDEEGASRFLEHEGAAVHTKLEEDTLRALASSLPSAQYIGAGTAPFHLGDLYRDFAANKATEGDIGEDDFVVYREGAFLLLPLALLLILLPEWRGRHLLTTATVSLLAFSATLRAESPEALFLDAHALLVSGKIEAALPVFESLATGSSLTPAQGAAVAFNRGLCLRHQAEQAASGTADERLALANASQQAFLSAARQQVSHQRASQGLEELSGLLTQLRAEVASEEEEARELNAKIADLIARLEKLLEDQNALIQGVKKDGPPKLRPRTAEAADPPADAAQRSSLAVTAQRALKTETLAITAELKALAAQLQAPDTENILAEPLRLIAQVATVQETAATILTNWPAWPTARPPQERAAALIEEILTLLSNNGDDSEEGEMDDEGDFEDWDESEEGEAQPSSMPMDGDFSSSALTQPLPLPNFSAEDILQEEMGNQQFRQEQRAKANAQKVEKDW